MERNEIVQMLCELWGDQLDVKVSPDDDFFDVGGNSVLIVTTIAEARKRGLELSAWQFYEQSTPAAIADASHVRPAGADLDFSTVWEMGQVPSRNERQSTLVPLEQRGSGTPVFCFPWGTGNVRFMRRFMNGSRGSRPVYGLEAVGLWGRQHPVLSLPELASRFLRDIRTVQPRGPYLFVAACSGGQTAYEVACQLEEAGERVAVLAVVNGMAPGFPDLDPGWGLRELYEFRLAYLRNRFGVPDLFTDQERVLQELREAAFIDDETSASDVHWRQVVWAAGTFSLEHYVPGPYNGELTTFGLSENLGLKEADWSGLVADIDSYSFEYSRTLALLGDATFTATLAKKLAAFND
jgi:thioesterase domain-containing protein